MRCKCSVDLCKSKLWYTHSNLWSDFSLHTNLWPKIGTFQILSILIFLIIMQQIIALDNKQITLYWVHQLTSAIFTQVRIELYCISERVRILSARLWTLDLNKIATISRARIDYKTTHQPLCYRLKLKPFILFAKNIISMSLFHCYSSFQFTCLAPALYEIIWQSQQH